MGRITIVGLGPAGSELITAQTSAAISAHRIRFVRTTRHPAAVAVADAVSFDQEYETADTFDDVYESISRRLLEAAIDHDVLYAVPGSPLVLERSVELIRDQADGRAVDVQLLPALSFLDVAWARLGIDPVEDGVRLIDGHRFATQAAGQTGPLLIGHCHAATVLSDIKLAIDEGDEGPDRVIVLQRLGLDDEAIFEVAWAELDRDFEPDHLTSIFIPELAQPVAAELVRFEELVRVLREQCPWDREQTHATLRRHLLEESYETLEALDGRSGLADDERDADADGHLEEELGDLLYQIYFHARLAAERGAFTIADVARGIHDKLVLRHPHVFGDVQAEDTSTVLSNWEAIKREEKGRESAMDGIPTTLPGLMLALKVQKRAAAAGFDPDGGAQMAYSDVAAEVATVGTEASEQELGDLLFAAVQVARRLSLDPESAIRGAAQRFEHRIRTLEGNP